MEHEHEISPEQFLQWMEGRSTNNEAIIIDVREDFEWDYYHLDDTELMPMQTVPARMHELPTQGAIFVICAHGVRSAAVCHYLTRQGLTNCINVIGGMAAVAALKGFQYD